MIPRDINQIYRLEKNMKKSKMKQSMPLSLKINKAIIAHLLGFVPNTISIQILFSI